MNHNADCRRIREVMDSYDSGELAVESNHDVLAHLERCEMCRTELQRRQRMRALLIESFGPAPDAAPLSARIGRAIDVEQRRWWRLARYGGLAAALVLMVSAAVWLSRPVDAAAFDDSVDNHIACALRYPPGIHYDAERVSRTLRADYQKIVDAVAHRVGGYQLIDAHMCPYQGRDYAHLVYRGEGRELSVFVEPATRGRLPLTHEAPRKGFEAEGRSSGDHQVFVVTDHAARPDRVVRELLHSTLVFARTLSR